MTKGGHAPVRNPAQHEAPQRLVVKWACGRDPLSLVMAVMRSACGRRLLRSSGLGLGAHWLVAVWSLLAWGLLSLWFPGGTPMNLDPGGLIAWLIVGLIAGWLAGQFMKGSGYGLVGDIIVGIIGAFIGGFLASFLGLSGSTGLIGSIVVAFIGAVILIAILRAVGGSRARA